MTSRLIEGEFPNYHQLLPDTHESRLTVSRQQLLDAVRRVGLLARDTTPVRLEFNALGVKLSSSSPDLGLGSSRELFRSAVPRRGEGCSYA